MGANAQISVPTFTAGEVLTAANMNISARTGIPVFADTTARDAAFGGTGEKTLAEGQFAYIENIAGAAATQYYDGASWQTLVSVTPRIGQVVSTSKTDTFTSATTGAFTDITGLSVSITPTSATSKVLVIATAMFVRTVVGTASRYIRLVRDSTAIAVGDTAGSRISASMGGISAAGNDQPDPGTITFLDSPATTSATTYKLQFYADASTFYLNRSVTDTNGTNGGRFASGITVMEVLV